MGVTVDLSASSEKSVLLREFARGCVYYLLQSGQFFARLGMCFVYCT